MPEHGEADRFLLRLVFFFFFFFFVFVFFLFLHARFFVLVFLLFFLEERIHLYRLPLPFHRDP